MRSDRLSVRLSLNNLLRRGSRGRSPGRSLLVTAAALAMIGTTAAPAAAVTGGDKLLGHRCAVYPATTTIENTVAAVKDVSQYPGVWCEIDARRLKDGTVISFHDPTWKRVADPASLKLAGVTADSPVAAATWTQVSKIRTKGGQPIARVEDMIRAGAQHNVGLIAELKGARASATEAKRLVGLAKTLGVDLWWYQNPEPAGCTLNKNEPYRLAGAQIGVKMTLNCPFTPAQLQSKGVTFISERPSLVTKAYVDAMRARGVTTIARNGSASNIKGMLATGAWKVMVNNPHQAVKW
jgi:glycerophosphoryl diester phosphodiesterase